MMLLKRLQLWMILAAAAFVAALVFFLIFSLPLMGKLKTLSEECKKAESEVSAFRAQIEALGGIDGEIRGLMAETDTSLALREITKQGQKYGVRFVAITPAEIEPSAAGEYRILPLEIEIDGTYSQIGKFLGALDRLDRAMATVSKFSLSRKDEHSSVLGAQLIVWIYVSL